MTRRPSFIPISHRISLWRRLGGNCPKRPDPLQLSLRHFREEQNAQSFRHKSRLRAPNPRHRGMLDPNPITPGAALSP